jgi:hypothetical protein
MGVVIANFSKIETRLKALYVRFWGIPEGVNLLLAKISKSLEILSKEPSI